MIKNHLKIAWRNLQRNRMFSIINITGLALGLSTALFVALWIGDEFTFDTYHTHQGRIAQVMDTQTINGESVTSDAIAIPVANALRERFGDDFSRVALAVPSFTHIVAHGDKKLSADGMWVQADLPHMLTLDMIYGSRDGLQDPSAALLTQSLANALFGKGDPTGRTFRLDNMADMQVAGVFADLPQNTTFSETPLFLPWDKAMGTFQWMREAGQDWDNRGWKLFVELEEQVRIEQVNAKIKDIAKPHVKGGDEELSLHPMEKWRLYSEFQNGEATHGRIDMVYRFGVIGLFVLCLACINFMNLSTAKSEKRIKEVGVLKTMGSNRSQLAGQFLVEAVLVAFLALLLTVVIVFSLLPAFNQLTAKQLNLPIASPYFWTSLTGVTFLTGLLSGSYPACYLSTLSPITALKGAFKPGHVAVWVRRGLVVGQFTISIALMAAFVVMDRQVQHAKNRPVGYHPESLITIGMNTPDLYGIAYDVLRDELLQTGVVGDMAMSSTRSTERPVDNSDFDWAGKDPGLVPLMGVVGVTHDFGSTLGWQINAGRDFSRAFPSDTGSVVLNQAAAKLTGFADPVGQTIQFYGKEHTIIGVVDNMVMESPYQSIQPTVFTLGYDWLNAITVRLDSATPLNTALAEIEGVFRQINPGAPFEYAFTNGEYAQKFVEEERAAKLFSIFAVLAISIACLGVFGLAAFMAEQRTKEIGIRKVLGASVSNIVSLLSKDFVKLVLIAVIIASPIAWWAMSHWLQGFAYRIDLQWWMFALAGFSALMIAMLTVSGQAIKAATANPVESLQEE